MRSGKLISVIILLLMTQTFLQGAGCVDERKEQALSRVELAGKFIDLLQAQKFADAESLMDQTMKQALAGGKLASLWSQLNTQFGKLSGIIETKIEPLPRDYERAVFVCQFQNTRKELLVTMSPQEEVSGFFVRDPAAGSIEPPYAERAKFTEQALKLGVGEYALDAVLSLPAGSGPFPALVLVHGSGGHDMDETVGAIKVFRDLAWGLASRGIAVLRYNKRSFQHARQLMPIADTLTLKEETVDDAVLAVGLLKREKKIEPGRIFVLGHSLGGLAMPRIALAAPDAAGYIIMAGNTRPCEDLILEQISYLKSLSGNHGQSVDAELAKLKEQVRLVKSPQLSSQSRKEDLPLGIPAAYWLDLRAHDPVKEAAADIKKPVLVLQGESDYQVSMKDFDGWKTALKGNKDASFISYPGLGHLFTRMSVPPSPSDYGKQGNVSQRVVEDIAAWLSGQSSKDK